MHDINWIAAIIFWISFVPLWAMAIKESGPKRHWLMGGWAVSREARYLAWVDRGRGVPPLRNVMPALRKIRTREEEIIKLTRQREFYRATTLALFVSWTVHFGLKLLGMMP